MVQLMETNKLLKKVHGEDIYFLSADADEPFIWSKSALKMFILRHTKVKWGTVVGTFTVYLGTFTTHLGTLGTLSWQPTKADPNSVSLLAITENTNVAHPNTQEIDRQQIQDLTDGLGWSSDKTLARYFNTSRKTIWCWAKEGNLPKPHKISDNTTRWKNAELKEMGCLLWV